VGQGLVVAWCGMRGLVTLATAQALPPTFPERDLIVLCAFAVLLGTLVLQGLTLGPLIVRLRFPPDRSFDRELSATRITLIDAAIAVLEGREDEAARAQREILRAARVAAAAGQHPREVSESDRLKRDMIAVKRRRLVEMRRSGAIDDDVFHALEQELDWSELASSPPERLQLVEG
jgi:CPA1 family monovalent cation:H+ antiporter